MIFGPDGQQPNLKQHLYPGAEGHIPSGGKSGVFDVKGGTVGLAIRAGISVAVQSGS
jgi:predicted amidohydrolase